MCGKDRPDLILMDLVMPVMNGVEATRRIMSECPCPILVVTSTVQDHLSMVFESMGLGALDAVNTPTLGKDPAAVKSREDFLKKIRTLEKLTKQPAGLPRKTETLIPPGTPVMVAIGSSTGGPKALAEVLSGLSPSLPAAVVIVQHVNQEFTDGLAAWLSDQGPFAVEVARPGQRPQAGHIYLAGRNDHLIITSALTFTYTPDPQATPYRPSVDEFFKSLQQNWPGRGVAVILTGMGRDGAAGMALLHGAHWKTIAQDQASSVVYGMPKAAVELGVAESVLPINEVASAVTRLVNQLSRGGGNSILTRLRDPSAP